MALRASPFCMPSLGSLDSWAGQGPTHMALLPTVCNFMSHEKCVKHVKTACTSVAPSLVRVRTECGLPHCQEGQRGRDGRLCQVLSWWSGLWPDRLGVLLCACLGPRAAAGASLPAGSQFPPGSPALSLLLIGGPPAPVLHPGCPKCTTGEQTWGKWSVPGFLGQRSWSSRPGERPAGVSGQRGCLGLGCGDGAMLVLHRLGCAQEDLGDCSVRQVVGAP